MRNRLIALLAGLMVLSIAGAALAAPSVDRVVDLDLTFDDAKLQYRLYDNGTAAPAYTDVAFPDDFIMNHGQMLKLIKTQLRDGWEGGLGCLVRELAKSELGKEDLGDPAVYPVYEFDELCKKKHSDELAPLKGKKSPGWVNPGQLKKAERAGADD